jgi:glycosyltransferase involved in cell wall biosynthesis
MGIPYPGRAGGPPTHLPFLVGYFVQHPEFIIRTFFYGAGSDNPESALARIIHTLNVWVKFLWLLITYQPDIIHLNTAFDPKTVLRDIPFSLTCYFFRKKLFLKFHGSLEEMITTPGKLWRILNRMVFLGAARIGVLSAPERQEFVEHYGLPGKFIVVRNIVPAEVSSIRQDEKSSPYTREPGYFIALFAARMIREKGLTDLIEALPQVLKNLPGFRLVVAGDGPDLQEAVELAGRLDVNNAIKWLGHLSHETLKSLFCETDCLIFPSRLPEGMPMTLLDAMKYKLPLITTQVRFAREYMQEPQNALFIERGNPDSIASAILKMAADPALRNTMVSNNLELIGDFSTETVGGKFAAIYLQMVNR